MSARRQTVVWLKVRYPTRYSQANPHNFQQIRQLRRVNRTLQAKITERGGGDCVLPVLPDMKDRGWPFRLFCFRYKSTQEVL